MDLGLNFEAIFLLGTMFHFVFLTMKPPPPPLVAFNPHHLKLVGVKKDWQNKKAKMFQQEDEEQHEQDAQDALQLAADLAEASLCENVSLIFSHFESQFISFLSFFFSNRSPNKRNTRLR